jgi:ribosomal protein S1
MSRPDLWSHFIETHQVGDVVDGEVMSVVPFGAFVRVDGFEGLAPLTQWPSLPETGDRVSARIAAIDVERQRFALHPA